MNIYKGAPENISEREPREARCYGFLEELGIEYLRADHEPAMTMEACVEIDASLGVAMCKNLFLTNRQQTDFYLLLMPDSKPFKTKFLSAALGVSRLSFGTDEQMTALLDLHPGSVSVLGLMNDKENRVRLVIDDELLNNEYFGCHPCKNTSSLRISTDDLLKKLIPALKHEPTVVKLLTE